ncbi:hypothetical protein E2F50_22445 [Rhizobium deserti]|uniref:Uncharacterized protein n=1 Tax=Rhizobium deserti TaxID=2547961 RepID=A0A4V3AN62_9HYPH|nr:hypothetical protein [Rhizobium deserti]TDK29603.1 hypothetical protein E2F50_22445 [Rhizobium deserti]
MMDQALNDILSRPDEMGRPGKPVTLKHIEDFESSQGHALPPELTEYWLAYGARRLGSKAIYTFTTKAVFPSGKRTKVDVGAIAGPAAMIEARERYTDPPQGNSGPRLPKGLYPLTFNDG